MTLLQCSAWICILAGTWLPWATSVVQEGRESEAKVLLTAGEKQPTQKPTTTYGLDTYQGWLLIWLPLLAMSLGAWKTNRNLRFPQIAVGILVCALASHLMLHPHSIGDASKLANSGGFFGLMSSSLASQTTMTIEKGLYVVFGGGTLFLVASIAGLASDPPALPGPRG